MNDEDFEQCPHCGDIIVRGTLYAHIDKKKCLQKGEADIMAELRASGRKCTNPKQYEVHIEFDPVLTIIKRFFKHQRPFRRKFAWIWIPYGKEEKYADNIHELEKDCEIRWMTER